MKKKGSSAIIYIIVIALLVAAALICLLAFADGRLDNLFNRGRSASVSSESSAEESSSFSETIPERSAEASEQSEEQEAPEESIAPEEEPESAADDPSVSEESVIVQSEAVSESEDANEDQAAEPTEAPAETPAETPTPEPVMNTDASGRVIPAEGEYLYDLETVEATTVVDESLLDPENTDKYFRSFEISDALFDRIYGDDRSYKTYCTVPREHLRYIKVLYHDFEGQTRVGEIMVNYLVADDIVYIFEELYKTGYQFELIVLVDDFAADDDISIMHNNTSAFNFRNVTGGDYPSNHAYGTAIDINPYNNPYIMYDSEGNPSWLDDGAGDYLDREAEDAYERHMINHSDPCFLLFAERGWSWGGDWTGIVDYQHFEKVIYP